MSGWWSCFSASAATWLTNSKARRNEGNCQERTSMSPSRSHPLSVGILLRISGSLSLAMTLPLRVVRDRPEEGVGPPPDDEPRIFLLFPRGADGTRAEPWA